jgi:hypothetical protein
MFAHTSDGTGKFRWSRGTPEILSRADGALQIRGLHPMHSVTVVSWTPLRRTWAMLIEGVRESGCRQPTDTPADPGRANPSPLIVISPKPKVFHTVLKRGLTVGISSPKQFQTRVSAATSGASARLRRQCRVLRQSELPLAA